MSEKITVEMSREQAQAVMDATELLARLHIGQFKEITWRFLDRMRNDGKLDMARRERADELLEQACRTIFGVNEYNWPNVGYKSIEHQRCWAVYEAIRYALAWHDYPEGKPWSVAFNEPLGYGEPLPRCVVKESGDEK